MNYFINENYGAEAVFEASSRTGKHWREQVLLLSNELRNHEVVFKKPIITGNKLNLYCEYRTLLELIQM